MTDRLWSQTPRVLFVTTNTPDICTLWRCWWPTGELRARGYTADFIQYKDLGSLDSLLSYGRYTTVVTPRMVFEDYADEQSWCNTIAKYRDQVDWWYDLDDDLVSEDFVARQVEVTLDLGQRESHDVLVYRSNSQRQSRIRLIEQCDGVTVGSDLLESMIKPMTQGIVKKIPNGINHRFFFENLSAIDRAVPQFTIGWSGGPRLERDLEPLYEVWPKIAQSFPDVHFLLQGWAPSKLADLLPPDRVHVIGGVPIDQYPAILKNIDVFCCVGTDDPFVLAKTPIKHFEAALTGATTVASKPLYGDVVHHAQDGLVCNSTDEWIDNLSYLLKNPEMLATLQKRAFDKVMAEHTIASTYDQWLDVWAKTL